ncbi:MAG: DegT/DnrJ/EryC1/StrS family aminotransferase [Armatimonadetes bacterium]|nr:DegT/DnrJ/EryC1/StrS family aminotransferase [Armatimonadota bacterium]
MDAATRRHILDEHGKPETPWRGEPNFGGWYTEEEIEVAVQAIRSSLDWKGEGFGGAGQQEIVNLESAFAAYCGTSECVSVNGAAGGLDMALEALDLEPHDEVIVPAVNFRASSMSVIGQGARLVFAEADPRTFQLDPADVIKRLTPNTRAIFPTHMNGLSAPIDDYLEIAEQHPHPKYGPPKVIGDAARACGGGYRGTKIGKRGYMTVFSFHTMKLMTTLGEGGAITTDDPDLAARLRDVRMFGGQENWGSNYKMTKVQAAVGCVQVRRLDEMIALRRKRAYERTAMLDGLPGITLPYEPPDCEHTFYLYTCLVPREWAGEKRNRLCAMMRDEFGVECVIANAPVYLSSGLIKRYAANTTDLPVSEELGARLFCPSLHPLMTERENAYLCAALWECVERLQ